MNLEVWQMQGLGNELAEVWQGKELGEVGGRERAGAVEGKQRGFAANMGHVSASIT